MSGSGGPFLVPPLNWAGVEARPVRILERADIARVTCAVLQSGNLLRWQKQPNRTAPGNVCRLGDSPKPGWPEERGPSRCSMDHQPSGSRIAARASNRNSVHPDADRSHLRLRTRIRGVQHHRGWSQHLTRTRKLLAECHSVRERRHLHRFSRAAGSRRADPALWYASYVQAYVERDERKLSNVRDLSTFQRFRRLCAGRVGQFLCLPEIAVDAGITQHTARAWISLLEAAASDVVIEQAEAWIGVEIKSGQTVNRDYFKGLDRWMETAEPRPARSRLVYGGREDHQRGHSRVLSWRDLRKRTDLRRSFGRTAERDGLRRIAATGP